MVAQHAKQHLHSRLQLSCVAMHIQAADPLLVTLQVFCECSLTCKAALALTSSALLCDYAFTQLKPFVILQMYFDYSPACSYKAQTFCHTAGVL